MLLCTAASYDISSVIAPILKARAIGSDTDSGVVAFDLWRLRLAGHCRREFRRISHT